MAFDNRTLTRIQNAVHHAERTGPARPHGDRGKGRNNQGFWAQITDGNEGRYSWTALKLEDGELVEDEDWGSGSHEDDGGYAMERNSSEYVLENSIVWLEIFPTEHVYIFDYSPGIKLAKIVSSDTITGRVGNVPGEGNVTIEDFSGEQIATTEQTVTVFNNYRSTIEGETGEDLYLQIGFADGKWVVVGVDCLTEDEE